MQDLVVVGQKYHYANGADIVQDKGMDVMVYANKDNEDYTHHFEVDIYEEED